jgi:hypothetical protein
MTHLTDDDYTMDKNGSVWIDVRGFTVHLRATDEGVIVDIFDADDFEKNHGCVSAIASTWAHDHDLVTDLD